MTIIVCKECGKEFHLPDYEDGMDYDICNCCIAKYEYE